MLKFKELRAQKAAKFAAQNSQGRDSAYLRAVEVIAHQLERGGDDKQSRRRRVNAERARVHAVVVTCSAAAETERATGRVLQQQHVAHVRVASPRLQRQ
jgi:hypothetical protein